MDQKTMLLIALGIGLWWYFKKEDSASNIPIGIGGGNPPARRGFRDTNDLTERVTRNPPTLGLTTPFGELPTGGLISTLPNSGSAGMVLSTAQIQQAVNLSGMGDPSLAHAFLNEGFALTLQQETLLRDSISQGRR